ncbi:MAG: type VI secretion system-associated protein TagF [Limnobacter sp.]|nr:type VI secretion system-associated protein TagF [Limnobacter sp.]
MHTVGAKVQLGWFGKLPAHGDFLDELHQPALRQWVDQWLSEGLALAFTDPNYAQHYLNARPVYWQLANPENHPTTGGFLVPSIDSCGRPFPVFACLLAPQKRVGRCRTPCCCVAQKCHHPRLAKNRSATTIGSGTGLCTLATQYTANTLGAARHKGNGLGHLEPRTLRHPGMCHQHPAARARLARATAAERPPMSNPSNPQNHTPENTLPRHHNLNGFVLQNVVGIGGFGVVYEAQDVALKRTVAIKEYFPANMATRKTQGQVHVPNPQQQANFETGLRSFVNEARLLAQFDHPALVKVFQYWEEKGTAYMVMPFYHGPTLKNHLQSLAAIPPEAQVAQWLQSLTEALHILHTAGCIHRDVSPDNVILTHSLTQPVLLDFGAARQALGEQNQQHTVILKTGYAPVEQYQEVPNLQQGPWTDFYALGCLGHLALTGKTPPPALGRMVCDTYQPLAAHTQSALRHTIDRLLAVLPQDRPQNAAELLALLSGSGSTGSMHSENATHLPPRPQPPAPTKNTSPRLAWAALATPWCLA